MDLNQLEELLEWSSHFLLMELLFLTILFWLNRRFVQYDSVRALYVCYSASFFLAFLDWLFIVYFFTDNFPYLESHLIPIIRKLDITSLTFISPFSYLVKFICIGFFFRAVIADARWKKIFKYVIVALVIFEIVQVIFFHTYRMYDSLSSTLKNIFLILGTSLFLFRFYNNDKISTRLQKNPYFWISLSLLLPALADIFLEFIFQKLHQTDTMGFYKLYIVRNTSQAIGLLLMIVAVRYFKNLRFLPKEY